MTRPYTSVALAALALDLSAGAELQLTPAGPFKARDGRPSEPREGAWKIDSEIARRVIARIAARKTPTVIDYEHQTLLAETNGQPAPAAGWFTTVDWREGKGLFATDVTWTERAKQMIAAGEYRYFSPVIAYDQRSGEVIDIQMGAITNLPGIDGMQDVMLRAAARFNLLDEEDTTMKELLKQLLAALALPEAATEAEAISACAALKAKADKTATLETEVAALKAQTPDPAKFVPVAAMQDLQTKVAALSGALAKRDLDDLIEGAMNEGKLLPAQEKWARDLGTKDMEALRGYVASAQALPALRGTQTTRNRRPGISEGGDPVAAAKAKFESDPAIREEFLDLETYTAYCKANAAGNVKILGRQAA